MSQEEQEQRFKGLEWVPGYLSPDPRWTIEPDLGSIKRTIEEHAKSPAISVSLLYTGGLSKVYDVQVGNQARIVRVSLPVDPEYKTLSEVATVNWTRHYTSLPVPNVIAYQANRDNAIGFKWILMEKIPGKPLKHEWHTMQYAAKEHIVQQVAAYFSSLYKHRLLGIGNIYPGGSESSHPSVGRIVSMSFFWGDHIKQDDVPRGPFQTSKEWLSAWLSFNKNDCNSILAKIKNGFGDGSGVKDAEGVLRVVERLESHLSELFDDCPDPEITMLINDDLSNYNILVDENGTLTGVVDWQCVSSVPLWKACYYPSFIEGPHREEKPVPNKDKHSDDENYDSLYWQHLREYEHTKLRRYFLDEMRRLEPEWVKIFVSSTIKRDFHFAVENCNIALLAKPINEWLDDIDRKEETVRRLTDILAEHLTPGCCD